MKKMNKKGGLKAWGTFFIIFCMTVTSMVFISNSMFSFYDTEIGSDYEPIYGFIETSIGGEKNNSLDMQQGVGAAEISDPNIYDTVSMITGAVIVVLKIPFKTLYGVTTTISLVAKELPVPEWIVEGVLALMMISLSITLLAWYFNRQLQR